MERVVTTLTELEEEARRLIGPLVPQKQGATLVTLSGELGAGKTAFTKAVAKVLGIDEVVTSPTFVLEKIYPLHKQSFKRLVHIDVYRLEKGSELTPLGFDELMKDSGNLVMLEWPEKVEDALPVSAMKISLTARPDGVHTISYG